MWVVVNEPTTAAFTVHMEPASHQLTYSPTAAATAAATVTTSPTVARARKSPVARASKSPRKVTSDSSDNSDACAPPQALCRYANKKCTNPRAVKRTGGLHTFCAMHRENANRNQRRLDLRKRLQKQAMQSSALLDRRQVHRVDLGHLQIPRGERVLALDVHHSDTLYEPHATPTSLRDEDVATLITLFASADQLSHDPLCLDDVPMPREPLFDFSFDARLDL